MSRRHTTLRKIVPLEEWHDFLRTGGVAEEKLPTPEEYWQQLRETVAQFAAADKVERGAST